MIRETKYATRVSDNVLRIETNSKFFHLAVNYQKGSEKAVEIFFMIKIKDLEGHFKLYEKYTNKPVTFHLTEEGARISTIDLPPFCEEVLITVNYLGIENEKSLLDIYPIGYSI